MKSISLLLFVEVWLIGVVLVIVGRSGILLTQWALAVWFVLISSLRLAGLDEVAARICIFCGVANAALAGWACMITTRVCEDTYFYFSCLCLQVGVEITCVHVLTAGLLIRCLEQSTDDSTAAYLERLVVCLAPLLGTIALVHDYKQLAVFLSIISTIFTVQPLPSSRDLSKAITHQRSFDGDRIPVKSISVSSAWLTKPKKVLLLGSRSAALINFGTYFIPMITALAQETKFVAVVAFGLSVLVSTICLFFNAAIKSLWYNEPLVRVADIPWWFGSKPRNILRTIPCSLSAIAALLSTFAITQLFPVNRDFEIRDIVVATATALLFTRLLSSAQNRRRTTLVAVVLGFCVSTLNSFVAIIAAIVSAYAFPGLAHIIIVPSIRIVLATQKEDEAIRWLLCGICIGPTSIFGSAFALCLSLGIAGILLPNKCFYVSIVLFGIRLVAAAHTSCAEVTLYGKVSIKPRVLLAFAAIPRGHAFATALLLLRYWLKIEPQYIFQLATLFGAFLLSRGKCILLFAIIFCGTEAFFYTTHLWYEFTALAIFAKAGLGTSLAFTFGASFLWLENTLVCSIVAVLFILVASISIHDTTFSIALVSALGVTAIVRHAIAYSSKKQAETLGALAVGLAAIGAGCSGLFLIIERHKFITLALASCLKIIASLSARHAAHKLMLKTLAEEDIGFKPMATTNHVLIDTVSVASDIACIDAYALTSLTAAVYWRTSTAFALAAPVLIILRRPNQTIRALKRKVQSSRHCLVVHSGDSKFAQKAKIESSISNATTEDETDHLIFELSDKNKSIFNNLSHENGKKQDHTEIEAAVRACIPLVVAATTLLGTVLYKSSSIIDIFFSLLTLPLLVATFMCLVEFTVPNTNTILALWPLALAPTIMASRPEPQLLGFVATVVPILTTVIYYISSFL